MVATVEDQSCGCDPKLRGTARSYGLSNPFDADAAIDAQAHLMRDLLRRFASVPLALAAYNAGPAPWRRIFGLLGGAGEALGAGLQVRLVE